MDTHCRRIGNRLGWFDAPSRRISLGRLREMEAAIPENLRKPLHIRQIQHGRSVCLAEEPDCESCVIQEFCDYYHAAK
jgi:endonuclease-3